MDLIFEDVPVNQDYYTNYEAVTAPSFTEEAKARFEQSYMYAPTSSIDRWMEIERAEVTDSPMLTADQWEKSPYFRQGLSFPDGVKEDVASILADRKDAEVKRQSVMERSKGGLLRKGSMFAVDLAAQLVDPLNVASAFVPIVSSARFTALTDKVGRFGARAITGGVEGLAGAAMVEPVIYGAAQQEQSDYTMYDSMAAIGLGAGFGAGLHTTFGAIGDALGITSYAQKKALETSISQSMLGENVNVASVLNAGARQGTEFTYNGPRATFLNEVRGFAEHSEDEISHMFGIWDGVATSAKKKGLIDDVNNFYTSLSNSAKTRPIGELFSETDRILKSFSGPDVDTVLRNSGAAIVDFLERTGDTSVSTIKGAMDEFVNYVKNGTTKNVDMIPEFEKVKSWMVTVYDNLDRGTFDAKGFESLDGVRSRREATKIEVEIDKLKAQREKYRERMFKQNDKLRELDQVINGHLKGFDQTEYRFEMGQIDEDVYKALKKDMLDTLEEQKFTRNKILDELQALETNMSKVDLQLDASYTKINDLKKSKASAREGAKGGVDINEDVRSTFDEFSKRDKAFNAEPEAEPRPAPEDPTYHMDDPQASERVHASDGIDYEKATMDEIDAGFNQMRKELLEKFERNEFTKEEQSRILKALDAENTKIKNRESLLDKVMNCVIGGVSG